MTNNDTDRASRYAEGTRGMFNGVQVDVLGELAPTVLVEARTWVVRTADGSQHWTTVDPFAVSCGPLPEPQDSPIAPVALPQYLWQSVEDTLNRVLAEGTADGATTMDLRLVVAVLRGEVPDFSWLLAQ
jgi:hypothetical protein